MRLALLILLSACYRETPPVLANKVTREASALEITATKAGPIDRDSKATLTDLRARFVGFEVRPFNDGSLEYDVYLGGEKLLYVVPDDDGSVFNVHAVSSKVTVEGRSWRVGTAFGDAARITRCECWGPHPTCYATGEHVAVNFDRPCDGLTDDNDAPRSFRALDGLTVQRVIWSPTPFGEDPHGGGADGL